MPSAFKLFPADETATGGEFGTSPFGTEPFGGTQAAFKYELPANEVGGDDPEKSYRWAVGESELRRQGKLVGARKWGEWRVWGFVFGELYQPDLEALVQFFRARRFKFLPDTLEEESYIESHWLGDEFWPQSHRGAYYSLAFEIEEM